VRLLLDTHVALWAVTDDARLSNAARSLISDTGNAVFVSAASVWEVSIKHGLARGRPGDMPLSGADALRHFSAAGYEWLPVSPAHAAAVERLPRLHEDPFDRMLLAQAVTEPLSLLTRDPKILAYGSPAMAV
jgi:PIN domain nuclease of toxin-antitoxin system